MHLVILLFSKGARSKANEHTLYVVVLNTGTVKIFSSKILKQLKNFVRTSAVLSSDKKFVGTITIPPSQSNIDNKKALYKSSTP